MCGIGGKDTVVDTNSPGPRKEIKRVRFWDVKVGGEATPVTETAESSRRDTRVGVEVDALPSRSPRDIRPVWECDWGEAYSRCPTKSSKMGNYQRRFRLANGLQGAK